MTETHRDVKNGRPGLTVVTSDPEHPERWCYLDQVVGVRVDLTK